MKKKMLLSIISAIIIISVSLNSLYCLEDGPVAEETGTTSLVEEEESFMEDIKDEDFVFEGLPQTEDTLSENQAGEDKPDDELPETLIPHYYMKNPNGVRFKLGQWSADCGTVAMLRVIEQAYYNRYGEDIAIDGALMERGLGVNGPNNGLLQSIQPYVPIYFSAERQMHHVKSDVNMDYYEYFVYPK